MAYTPKDFTGSLWVNDRKTSETHPDRTGTIMVAGVEYYLNGWLKKTQDGKPYLSLALKPKRETAKPERDDEIPF
jgi:uncharacterized protein (DUF736 family)